ncbi:hypothetical protein KBD68_01145 [Candidatus Woesebacteria bacterium]|nr:hypothetical protein [Candidatus Woesebacteria bacterium]
MKNNKALAILTVLVLVIFLWIFVRPVVVKSSCYRMTHDPRPHESDLAWAEGKHWVESSLLDKFRGKGSEAGWKYTNDKDKDYEECLLRNGLK